MRPLVVLWLLALLLLLLRMQPTPPSSSPSSSLAQRHPRRVREARSIAMAPLYHVPRMSPNRRALHDISNRRTVDASAPSRSSSPSLDSQRSVMRDADRERQLALQETPSRRRRREPRPREDENQRPTSPTPGASTSRRPVPQQRPGPSGLQTPPTTTVAPNAARVLAQQRRREREAAAKAAGNPVVPAQARQPPGAEVNRRAVAQQQRREREAQDRLQQPAQPRPPEADLSENVVNVNAESGRSGLPSSKGTAPHPCPKTTVALQASRRVGIGSVCSGPTVSY
ncbi:hypothetical protein B0H14DRAFT_3610827 [Mycena olivaceomarginata]|nr:hypothetical protein B0H14DRAFT_3610827 [Mycena olivaceomarginata]